jgi:hypothetical protein
MVHPAFVIDGVSIIRIMIMGVISMKTKMISGDTYGRMYVLIRICSPRNISRMLRYMAMMKRKRRIFPWSVNLRSTLGMKLLMNTNIYNRMLLPMMIVTHATFIDYPRVASSVVS